MKLHGYATDNRIHKENKSEVYTHDDDDSIHVSGPSNPASRTKYYVNCGLNNHDGSECRKPRVQRKSNNNDIVCSQCNQVGHKRNQCPMNRNGSVHKTAAVYQMNECVPRHGPNYENLGSQQCDKSQEVQLACGCRLPIVAGSFSLDGRQKLGQWETQMMPCASGQVNDKAVSVIKDTGSTVCMVRASLVKPEQITGSYDCYSDD